MESDTFGICISDQKMSGSVHSNTGKYWKLELEFDDRKIIIEKKEFLDPVSGIF